MNIAIIIAGGSGQRMQQDIPKQFINVYDKPIIIYTLENFQNNPNINSIVVVCIEGWQNIVSAYARQFNISKLDKIVNSGKTRHNSIYNGLIALTNIVQQDDIIIIMDANRPLVSDDVINDSIEKCKDYGYALPVVPCIDSMYFSENGINVSENIQREKLFKGQTPESIKYKKAMELYKKANALEIENLSTSALLIELGEQVFFSKGSEKNIKITTTEDIEIFKALLNEKKASWLK